MLNPPAFDENDEAPDGGDVPGTLLQASTYFAGRYRVLRLLALGGIAEVYEAWDLTEERSCALKILRLQYRRSEKIRLQMAAEARALKEFHHPNIVCVWDAGVTGEGLIYIVMELLNGTTLHDAIYGAPDMPRPDSVPLRVVLQWMGQLAGAVHALHLANIVHRDLKPDNVFISRDGQLKVLDLGAAKFRCYGLKTTGAHRTIGTPPYMSPEHLRGDATIDGRSDVYSLGHVFYELIARRHAFCAPGDSHSADTYRAWQEQRRPEPLTAMRPGLPDIVSELILKALEKRREDRWQSCEELAFAARGVSDYLEHEGLLWDPPAVSAEALPRMALVTTLEALPCGTVELPVVRVQPAAGDVAPGSAAGRQTERGTVIIETACAPARRANAGPPAPPPQSGMTLPLDPRPAADPRHAAVAVLFERMSVRSGGGDQAKAPSSAAPPSTRTTTLEVVTTELRSATPWRSETAASPSPRPGSQRPASAVIVGLAFTFALGGAVTFYLTGPRAAAPSPAAASTPAAPLFASTVAAPGTVVEPPPPPPPSVAPAVPALPGPSVAPAAPSATALVSASAAAPQASPPRTTAKPGKPPAAKSTAPPPMPRARPKSDRILD